MLHLPGLRTPGDIQHPWVRRPFSPDRWSANLGGFSFFRKSLGKLAQPEDRSEHARGGRFAARASAL